MVFVVLVGIILVALLCGGSILLGRYCVGWRTIEWECLCWGACVWRLCGDTCVLVVLFCRFYGGVFVEVLVSGRYWVCGVIVSVLLLCRLCYCVV